MDPLPPGTTINLCSHVRFMRPSHSLLIPVPSKMSTWVTKANRSFLGICNWKSDSSISFLRLEGISTEPGCCGTLWSYIPTKETSLQKKIRAEKMPREKQQWETTGHQTQIQTLPDYILTLSFPKTLQYPSNKFPILFMPVWTDFHYRIPKESSLRQHVTKLWYSNEFSASR